MYNIYIYVYIYFLYTPKKRERERERLTDYSYVIYSLHCTIDRTIEWSKSTHIYCKSSWKMLEEARCHTTTFFTEIVIIKPTNMCLSIVLLYYPGTSWHLPLALYETKLFFLSKATLLHFSVLYRIVLHHNCTVTVPQLQYNCTVLYCTILPYCNCTVLYVCTLRICNFDCNRNCIDNLEHPFWPIVACFGQNTIGPRW